MKYLIDTNVISELRKDLEKRNLGVIEFMDRLETEDVFVSIISMGEIFYGIQKLQDKNKKDKLLLWFNDDLINCYKDKMISLDLDIIMEWANIRAKSKKTVPPIDSLIAATAIVHNMTVVTRNTKDFENIEGLSVLNPFNE